MIRRPHRVGAAGLVGLVVAALGARLAGAHVDYVTEEPGASPDPMEVVAGVLADPVNAALLGSGALVAVLAGLAWVRWGHRVPDVGALTDVLADYEEYVPWMLRLSVGLPLVGSGFAGFLFTPVVPTGLRVPLVLVGFLLLLGLATRLAALVGLVGWGWAFLLHGQSLLLSGEFVGGFLAILALGPGRPSADHMLAGVASRPGTWFRRIDPVHEWSAKLQARLEPMRGFAGPLVRVPLGATFVYLGMAEKLADPARGLALARELGLDGLFGLDAGMWLVSAGLVEAGVGLLLVLGLFARAASAAAFLVLTTTLLALPNDPVLPHVTLFGLASVVFTLGAGPLSLDAWRTGTDRPP